MARGTAFAFIAVVGISQIGCHAANWDDGVVHPDPVSRHPQYGSSVDSDELRATEAISLRDALARTRPEFLRTTPLPGQPANEGAPPSVYIDGRYGGPPDVLLLVQVAEVKEVRFLRPTTARITLGAACACAGGVIAVTTRAR